MPSWRFINGEISSSLHRAQQKQSSIKTNWVFSQLSALIFISKSIKSRCREHSSVGRRGTVWKYRKWVYFISIKIFYCPLLILILVLRISCSSELTSMRIWDAGWDNLKAETKTFVRKFYTFLIHVVCLLLHSSVKEIALRRSNRMDEIFLSALESPRSFAADYISEKFCQRSCRLASAIASGNHFRVSVQNVMRKLL